MIYGPNFVLDDDMHSDMVVMKWNNFVNFVDDKKTEDDTNLRDENNALNDDADDLC